MRRPTRRDWERIRAVLEEFASRGQWVEPLYVPPWMRRDAYGNQLGECGPTCDGEYAREVADYRMSVHGGGLWDPDEDAPRKIIARKTRPIERPDAWWVVEYLERCSADIPEQEICVGLELYVGGATLSAAAKRLNIKRSNVARANRLLIRRFMAWADGVVSCRSIGGNG